MQISGFSNGALTCPRPEVAPGQGLTEEEIADIERDIEEDLGPDVDAIELVEDMRALSRRVIRRGTKVSTAPKQPQSKGPRREQQQSRLSSESNNPYNNARPQPVQPSPTANEQSNNGQRQSRNHSQPNSAYRDAQPQPGRPSPMANEKSRNGQGRAQHRSQTGNANPDAGPQATHRIPTMNRPSVIPASSGGLTLKTSDELEFLIPKFLVPTWKVCGRSLYSNDSTSPTLTNSM